MVVRICWCGCLVVDLVALGDGWTLFKNILVSYWASARNGPFFAAIYDEMLIILNRVTSFTLKKDSFPICNFYLCNTCLQADDLVSCLIRNGDIVLVCRRGVGKRCAGAP